MTPTVLAITVTYSPGATLEACVGSLERNDVRPRQVVVVDNGSTDGAPEALVDTHARVTLVRSPGNVGYGRAVNLGSRSATTGDEWLLVCNPDTVATPDTISTLLAEARSRPRAGALGPRIVEPSGAIYPSARALPSIRTGIGHALFSGVWPTNPWTRRYQQRDVSESDSARDVGWLSGAFLLIRREAFDAIGGFDEDFFMYFEDVDLGRRLSAGGWTNVYVPASRVTHIGGESTARAADVMVDAHHESALTYIRKTHPGVFWRPVVIAVGVGLRLRSLVVIYRSHRAPEGGDDVSG